MNSAVSDIIDAMFKLDDEALERLALALDEGMHDEWDCGLPLALEQFGPQEWRVALKTATMIAKGMEQRP